MEEDAELKETVESILGPGIRLLDVEKTTTVKSEETLLINGQAVPLIGPEGEIIKNALLAGQIPPSEILNALLISAGILAGPVRLETELTVKSTTLNRDAIQVSRHGTVVDERFKETKEEDCLKKTSTEIWRAVPVVNSNGNSSSGLVFKADPLPETSDEPDRSVRAKRNTYFSILISLACQDVELLWPSLEKISFFWSEPITLKVKRKTFVSVNCNYEKLAEQDFFFSHSRHEIGSWVVVPLLFYSIIYSPLIQSPLYESYLDLNAFQSSFILCGYPTSAGKKLDGPLHSG